MNNTMIIAIANQKGGVGKTTTTYNLGTSLARKDKKVLFVDLDPQANLTKCAGYSQDYDFIGTMAHLLDEEIRDEITINVKDCILKAEGCDLLPSIRFLYGVETQMVTATSRETLLKTILSPLFGEYDYILIDCNPNLGMLTMNALTVCDSVLIPMQAHILSLDGLQTLLQNVALVKRKLNSKIEINGILFTMVHEQANVCKDVMEAVTDAYGKHIKVYKNYIPQSVKAIEPQAEGQSIYKFMPKTKVALAYEEFTKEFINGMRGE